MKTYIYDIELFDFLRFILEAYYGIITDFSGKSYGKVELNNNHFDNFSCYMHFVYFRTLKFPIKK